MCCVFLHRIIKHDRKLVKSKRTSTLEVGPALAPGPGPRFARARSGPRANLGPGPGPGSNLGPGPAQRNSLGLKSGLRVDKIMEYHCFVQTRKKRPVDKIIEFYCFVQTRKKRSVDKIVYFYRFVHSNWVCRKFSVECWNQ